MKERNFVRKEKFGRYCRRQDENSERHDSTQNLGERCCRFFRLFGLSGNDRGQWNSQLAADGLTPLDFRQAITHLVLECDRILRPVLRIFAQQVHEQIVQHLGRPAQFGQAADPQTRFHSADRQWCRTGEQKTHCRPERIHLRSEIDLAIRSLFRTRELRRN